MAQQPPQHPSDDEWEQDENFYRNDLTQRARQVSSRLSPDKMPAPIVWEEDQYLFYLDLLALASKYGGIYQRSLDTT